MSFTDVIVAKPKTTTGGLTFGPVGLDIPKDATSELPAGQKPLGLVSSDGLTLTEDASDEDIFVWGAVKARKVRSEYSASLSGTLISTANPDTLRAVFGEDNVKVEGGKITVSGDRNLVDASADGFEVTIEALADSEGVCYHEIIQKTDGTSFEDAAGAKPDTPGGDTGGDNPNGVVTPGEG